MAKQNDGFIYVLSNDAMPGLLKIGATRKSPIERATELSTTGVPLPFNIVFVCYCDDVFEMEKIIHDVFEGDRLSPNREFFRTDPIEAIRIILNEVNFLSDHYVVQGDFVIDDGDLHRYAGLMFDGSPYDVVQVIDQFTKEEWQEAYSRLVAKREHRNKLRLNQESA